MPERESEIDGAVGAPALLLLGSPVTSTEWTGRFPLTEQFRVPVPAARTTDQDDAAYQAAVLTVVNDVPGRVHLVAAGDGVGVALTLAEHSARHVARIVLIEPPATAPAGVHTGALAAPVLAIRSARQADPSSWLTELAGLRTAVLDAPAGTVATSCAGHVVALVSEHLGSAATLAAGYASRREALGDAHVDQTIAAMSDYARPFQDFLTRYCWGEVWPRPGLSRRDRSLATIAGLVVLGAPHEITIHVRAGLRHGLTLNEVRELLQHMALYAGLPRAFGALQTVDRLIADDVELQATLAAEQH